MSHGLPTSLSRRIVPFLAVALLLAAVPARVHAQSWYESGDAGDLIATAQTTLGIGTLSSITGSLQSDADVDLYCIHVPATPPVGVTLLALYCTINQGPAIWLFDAAGNGVLANETCMAGYKVINIPAGSIPAGNYYVAVTYAGREPYSYGGDMWLAGVPGLRAPDGPGAGGPLVGWSGTPLVGPQNPYTIGLAFSSYCNAATPTARPTWGGLKSIYR